VGISRPYRPHPRRSDWQAPRPRAVRLARRRAAALGYRHRTETKGASVWAQLITARLKPGKEDELAGFLDRLAAFEQPGSGLVRQLVLLDTKDRSQLTFLIVFESEEQARAREQDPRRAAGLEALRPVMSEMFVEPPSFADLDVVAEHAP
jgi:hypothetical protein